MNIEPNRIDTGFGAGAKDKCYVHARGVIRRDGFGLITAQKLDISGCDVFWGIEMLKTADGGTSFSSPAYCKNLGRRYFEDGTSFVMCDATPFYHSASGKIILTGHMAWYGADNKLLREERPRSPLYAVYNEEKGDFEPSRLIDMPETENREYFSSGSGCCQITELENGELLIPIYYELRNKDARGGCSAVAVARCSFDGESISLLEMGGSLSVDAPRGLVEPSIVRYNGEYLLALRNDKSGYVAKSRDGVNFDQPIELCFESGENLGNYNTQQHWIVGGGRLWLVYTRRAGINDHIFRHRAPLFIGEFDPEKMCVISSTERIAVPERGARLGNFGCQSYSNDVGYVYAAEWMQNDPHGWEKCAEYGSDNSIFVSKISF